MEGITDEKPEGYWIPAGLFASKVILPYNKWQNLLEYIKSRDILNKLRYLDALKVAIYDNKIDKYMEDFEYGLDEVVLNSIINEYIKLGKIKIMVKNSIANKSIDFLRDRIKIYLKWNALKTRKIINLYKAFKVKSYDELIKKLDEKNNVVEFIKMFKNKEIIEQLNNLQIDKRIIYIMENFNQDEYNKYDNTNLYIRQA